MADTAERIAQLARDIIEEGRGHNLEIPPTDALRLARRLTEQDVDIGDIGIMCAVVGYKIGRKWGHK